MQTISETRKCKIDDEGSDQSENQTSAVQQPTRKHRITSSDHVQSASQSSDHLPPLQCRPVDLWHLRYGHASTMPLGKLKAIKSKFDSTNCTICIRAKQTHKSFKTSCEKKTQKLERIHSDICGQYPKSKGNSVYNLTFLDDFRHWY